MTRERTSPSRDMIVYVADRQQLFIKGLHGRSETLYSYWIISYFIETEKTVCHNVAINTIYPNDSQRV